MSPEPCDEIRPRLSSYQDGEIPADARARIEAHLERCTACRDELEAIARVARLVAGAAVAASPGFEGRLAARLETKHRVEDLWARRGRLARRACLVAAAVLVAALVGLGPTLLRSDRSGTFAYNDDEIINLALYGSSENPGSPL
jgi:anti-sigma factor RsiW